MSEDKIAKIRKRHGLVDRFQGSPSMLCSKIHEDRGILLAEVERLRVELKEDLGVIAVWRRRTNQAEDEVERLREALRDTAEDLESSDPTPYKLLAVIIRKALEGAP